MFSEIFCLIDFTWNQFWGFWGSKNYHSVWKSTIKRDHDFYKKITIFRSNQRFYYRSYQRVDFTEIFERDRVLWYFSTLCLTNVLKKYREINWYSRNHTIKCFTKILVFLHYRITVWKNEIGLTKNIFRQINSLVISLVKRYFHEIFAENVWDETELQQFPHCARCTLSRTKFPWNQLPQMQFGFTIYFLTENISSNHHSL